MRNRYFFVFAVFVEAFLMNAHAQVPFETSFRSRFGAFGFLTFDSVPALRGFDVSFTNGDHKLRDIVIAPLADTSYIVLVRDSSGVDPIAGFVKLMDVRDIGSANRVSRSDCVGRCIIQLPFSVGNDFALVLLGFDFHYSLDDGGPDTNVREISVLPWQHNGYVEVYFGDSAGTRPYYAQVDFSILPMTSLEFRDRVASASAPVRGTDIAFRSPGTALLQAFKVRFTESDHFLKRLMVDLTGNRIRMAFHDRDQNDPFLWTLRYAVLR